MNMYIMNQSFQVFLIPGLGHDWATRVWTKTNHLQVPSQRKVGQPEATGFKEKVLNTSKRK
jgi:hypothetical protein